MPFQCDRCGACRRQFLVEAYEIDALREQRFLQADPYYARLPTLQATELLQDEFRCCIIAGPGQPCQFLDGNRCSMYPTRPTVCVGMQAGDEQCQQAREAEGLPPLMPYPEVSGLPTRIPEGKCAPAENVREDVAP